MLTHAKAKSLTKPGRYGDGGGLYLAIAKGGSKSWTLRKMVDGQRRDLGLGGFPRVSLADARKKATSYGEALLQGRDPVTENRRPKVPTFKEAAAKYHALKAPKWADVHARQWQQCMDKYAMPRLGAMGVDRIARADVLGVLTPLFGPTPNTARRLRQRIRAVMKWAMAYGFIEVNPAGEAIDAAMPDTETVTHHAAIDYRQAPDAWQRIETLGAGRLCLRFLILTAARAGEASGARWSEIDLDAATWTIPASRMKARAEHRVPLSRPAVAVLEQARALDDGSGLVFPSPYHEGREINQETLRRTAKAAGLDCTVHGWRSTFRDWAAERTGASWAAMELSLAHAVGSNVERAYSRSDLLEQRRALMEAWGEYLTT